MVYVVVTVGRSTVSIGGDLTVSTVTEPFDALSLEPPHPESASADDISTIAEATRKGRSYDAIARRDPLASPHRSAPAGRDLTAQGHPRAIFSRAIEHRNLVAAETSAREIGNLTLEEALRLLFLYAEKDPIKYERAALRWLSRYVTEGKAVTLLKAQLTASALAELRAGEREQAAKLLSELARGR